MSALRGIRKLGSPAATSDGAGVKLSRVIGNGKITNKDVDPFLMMDHFHSDNPKDYGAGFPDHPHRGFETVTYMLAGSFEHRDKCGNKGVLSAGSIQWMTAGKGIIHSEMPLQEKGLVSGFQLWVNLPAKDKMCEPRYQDIPPSAIPVVPLDEAGSHVKVCAGTFNGVKGPVEGGYVKPQYLDVRLKPGVEFTHNVEKDHTVFAYLYVGSGTFAGKTVVSAPQLVLFDDSAETIHVKAGPELHDETFGLDEKFALRFILVSAKPLKEPVAQHGPFVMNTEEELMQAFRDYQNGKLGRY